jgi:branched-subunit amino acid aminotransferase/4-amino-4-deoxychorismate lyase
MNAILNNEKLTSIENINSLMLYGYANFTSFIYDGGIRGVAQHIKRLENDTKFLFNTKINYLDVYKNIITFLNIYNLEKAIIRVTIFQTNFELANPNNFDKLNILITGKDYSISNFSESAISLNTFNEARSFPLHKTTNLTVNIKARFNAKANGFDDALLIKDNEVLETSTANIFFYRNNILYTPKENVLLGTTRNLIIKYSKIKNIEIKESKISISDIKNFEGCFITNAVIGIKNINKINNTSFHINKEFTEKLKKLYTDIIFEELI